MAKTPLTIPMQVRTKDIKYCALSKVNQDNKLVIMVNNTENGE